jgi:hypothetical protein
MRTLFKRLLWLGAIFLVVWLAVVIYWQSTTRLPSEMDLVLYMGLLPLAIAGVVWGGYKIATHTPAPAAAPSTAGKDAAAQAAADTARQGAEQEKSWTLNIVASSLFTSAGPTPAEVLTKLKEGPIEDKLDPELKNEAGFAIMSSRIEGLDAKDTLESLTQWAQETQRPAMAWTDGQLRALHLAQQSIDEVARISSEHPALQRFLELKEAGRNNPKDDLLPLRLVLMWPHHWAPEQQAAASAWMKSLVVEHHWPEHKIVVQDTKSDNANPISLLDHITVTSQRAQLPTLGILLACDSGIDENYVKNLATNKNLFGGKTPQGAKPGELAAALLFADAQQTKLLGDLPTASLHRASWAVRDKSADESGRVSASLLSEVTGLAIETAKVEINKIRHIITDNDHKPSRESELAEMMNAKFPELDSAKETLKVAQACGSTHHATTAAALCVAHQYVVDENAAVLCTSLHDARLRAAVVLSVPAQDNSVNALANSKAA